MQPPSKVVLSTLQKQEVQSLKKWQNMFTFYFVPMQNNSLHVFDTLILKKKNKYYLQQRMLADDINLYWYIKRFLFVWCFEYNLVLKHTYSWRTFRSYAFVCNIYCKKALVYDSIISASSKLTQ